MAFEGGMSGSDLLCGCDTGGVGRRGRQEEGAGRWRHSAGEWSMMGSRGAEGREGNCARPGKLQCQIKEFFALQAENQCPL